MDGSVWPPAVSAIGVVVGVAKGFAKGFDEVIGEAGSPLLVVFSGSSFTSDCIVEAGVCK